MQLLDDIKQFHRENSKYRGFVQMEIIGSLTLLVLVMNIIQLTTDLVDWLIFALDLLLCLNEATIWLSELRLNVFKTGAEMLLRDLSSHCDRLRDEVEKLLSKECKWIPVSPDTMPEILRIDDCKRSNRLLFVTSDNEIHLGYYDAYPIGEWCCEDGDLEDIPADTNRVTHWMPLPKDPSHGQSLDNQNEV